MKISKEDVLANAWSNYWTNDFLTTFVDHQDENYTGKIKMYWDAIFSQVQTKQEIVDLAAGNGALLALAKDYFSDKDLQVSLTATDIADISNSSFYRENDDIEVLNGIDLASIPLADNSIDLCISQFGFEYSDTGKSSKEVSRILRPQGRLHLIMHHASSYISTHSRSAIEQIRLCANSGLIQKSEKLLRRLQKLKKSHRDPAEDSKASELREHFNQMAARLMQYGEKLPDADHIKYFLNDLGNLFSDKSAGFTLEQKLMIIEKLEADSLNYKFRMASMLEASMDQEQASQLKESIINAGLEVTSLKTLKSDGKDHAWILEAKKH